MATFRDGLPDFHWKSSPIEAMELIEDGTLFWPKRPRQPTPTVAYLRTSGAAKALEKRGNQPPGMHTRFRRHPTMEWR